MSEEKMNNTPSDKEEAFSEIVNDADLSAPNTTGGAGDANQPYVPAETLAGIELAAEAYAAPEQKSGRADADSAAETDLADTAESEKGTDDGVLGNDGKRKEKKVKEKKFFKKTKEKTDKTDAETLTDPVSDASDGGEQATDEVSEDEKARRDKKKAVDKKRRIINITVVVLAIAAVLAVAITVPIVVVNKGKIFVADAEDFTKVDKGDIFVLSRDVVVEGDLKLLKPYSIDLNKHTLTVKGNLVYDFTDAAEGTVINIGSRKGKKWIAGGAGSLDVTGDARVTAPNAAFAVYGGVNAVNYEINVKKFDSFTSFRASGKVSVQAAEMNFGDKIVFPETGSVNLTGGKAVMNAPVNAVVSLYSTKLTAGADAEIHTVRIDGASEFTTQGKITQKVTNAVEGARGKEAYFYIGATCPLVENIETVRIYVADSKVDAIENYGSIIYMEKLNTPLNVNIVDEGGRIICVVAEVNNAAFYEFTIDGEAVATQNSTRLDITDRVSEVGSHRISVVAKGEDSGRFIASEPVETTYNYEVKLATPRDITISQTDGKVLVKLPSVAFADEYAITINGNTVQFKKNMNAAEQEFDVSSMVSGVGEYSVNVVAVSYNNVGFKNSNAGAASFKITDTLGTPEATGTISENSFTVSWNAVANAKYYTVYKVVTTENRQILEVVKTVTATSVAFDKSTLEAGASFVVRANGVGFHSESAFSAAAVYTPQ